ncbi:N-acetylmuramoyl-L-alanine amidase [Ferrovibrio terrae]|uniref:N-acetylmuramoyl-L-alanine amidase n=1 Tax=Ferrovibrio terrae TaxID=2594003 RepID=A0A516H3D0_9PROT|nr:N-acetylmuramoyl-L-alanine amidase [Ferrovibrio terrae]
MLRFAGPYPQGLSCRDAAMARGIFIKLLFLLVFIVTTGLGLASPARAEPLRLTHLQLGLNAGLTRLVIEASAPPQAELAASADGLGLLLTLPATRWAAPPPDVTAGGLVAALGLPVAAPDGTLNIAIELIEPAVVERAFHLAPQGRRGHRLVIDLRPADPNAFAAAYADPVHLPLDTAVDIAPPPVGAAGERRRLIVLDPGHGGQDPGAITASGRYEKEITLNVARAVAQKLRATGRYRVLLTRESDKFIRLNERVGMARAREADLFLSIHADSLSGDRATRGASVYTRAEAASDTEAESLALRENRADQLADGLPVAEMDDVVSILLDLASRDTVRLSSRFAGLLTASMGETTPLRRNALRAANFRVLSAPDVPSALLELGYLSNPADEALLFSEAGRDRLAGAVVGAIDRFFGVEAR